MASYTRDCRPTLLKPGDYVSFLYKGKLAQYVVNSISLFSTNILCNHDHIFNILDIKDISRFCAKYYDYSPIIESFWPTCKPGDFQALTNLVNGLFKLIDDLSRYNVMDLEGYRIPVVRGTKERPYTVDHPPQLTPLKHSDYVDLDGLLYQVGRSCLLCESGFYGNEIFKRLGVVNTDMIAARSYGYKSEGGFWPEYRADDYLAPTRLVNYLFTIIKSKRDDKVQRQTPAESGTEGSGSIRVYKCTGTVAAPELNTQHPVRGAKSRVQVGGSEIRSSAVSPSYY